ncbi:unnamed protein product [Trifolium pratense]|uniref:Uncharacterized protein n=1 Tax=Trifolium pratense TaxID=57577 RepID=A0ACB0JBN2_TRIPR|nr:unnamed protein product [Trifolium pratense]
MSSGVDQPPPQSQPETQTPHHVQVQPTNTKPEDSASHTADYAPYPKLDPNDVVPPPQPAAATQSRATDAATTMPAESNPYVSPAPVSAPTSAKSLFSLFLPPFIIFNYSFHLPQIPSFYSFIFCADTLDSVKDVLGKWGKKAAEATKKAEDLAGNMWQHLKTGPSFADAAVGRIAQGTKVLAEGGYEKIFRQSFETVPEEQLLKTYACYLSTSAGPVMGVLYLSTAKLAFCSDNPLSYQTGDQTQWSYYKVVIPLHQLRAVNPSTSKANASEKFIQIISVDNHEFWFMGFVYYDNAVKHIQEALQSR